MTTRPERPTLEIPPETIAEVAARWREEQAKRAAQESRQESR